MAVTLIKIAIILTVLFGLLFTYYLWVFWYPDDLEGILDRLDENDRSQEE